MFRSVVVATVALLSLGPAGIRAQQSAATAVSSADTAEPPLSDAEAVLLESGAVRCSGVVCVYAPKQGAPDDSVLKFVAAGLNARVARAIDTTRTMILRAVVWRDGSLSGVQLAQGSGVAPDESLARRVLREIGGAGVPARGISGDSVPIIAVLASPPVEQTSRVYIESEIDRPAAPAPGCSPQYPPSLRQTRIGGEVLAQFVVDQAGYADLSTFKVISSTNTAFTASVMTALRCMRYIPAEHRGRRVRQLVRQPFNFRHSP